MTAFGVNADRLPAGLRRASTTTTTRRTSSTSSTRARARFEVGGEERVLGPGGLCHVESTTPRKVSNASATTTSCCSSWAARAATSSATATWSTRPTSRGAPRSARRSSPRGAPRYASWLSVRSAAGGRLCRPGGQARSLQCRAVRRGLVGEPWVPPRSIRACAEAVEAGLPLAGAVRRPDCQRRRARLVAQQEPEEDVDARVRRARTRTPRACTAPACASVTPKRRSGGFVWYPYSVIQIRMFP